MSRFVVSSFSSLVVALSAASAWAQVAPAAAPSEPAPPATSYTAEPSESSPPGAAPGTRDTVDSTSASATAPTPALPPPALVPPLPPPPPGSAPASAADASKPPSLLGKKVVFSGYGGVDVLYTRMFERDGAVVGLKGALLLDHRLALGLAGYGWTNPVRGPATSEGVSRRYQTGYGGFTVHYSIYWDSPAYVTIGALMGGGAVALTPTRRPRHDEDDWDYDDERVTDTFVVLQPDVTLHLNLTPWLRAGVTAGYRVTGGVGYLGFQESDLNGLVAGATLQVGNF